LTNILYTGVVRHKGQAYAGEHAAILPPGQWERVQTLIATRPEGMIPCGRFRNKHLALLSGLLFCECCAARMVYSYASKGGRKYPYYVCRNAQTKGWAACPSKSLPARAIEESVLRRVREEQSGDMADGATWEQMDRVLQVAAIRARVERVGFDGRDRQITIRFRSEEHS
jgi:site-specific DNA recombinase